MRSLPSVLLLVPALACTPNYGVAGKTGSVDGGADTGSDGAEDEDFSAYDGAVLEILSPASGSFLPLGEPADFEAVLTDVDGNELEFDEVLWTSNLDADWSATGLSAELSDMPAGMNSFTAVAALPNGDRVADAVGGVVVQAEDTGVYAGNMVLIASGDYNGTPISASCVGGAIVTVAADGETASGSSNCVISLLGFSQEAPHAFEFELADGEVTGSAALDLFIPISFEVAGDVGDGSIQASWASNVLGYLDLEGSLEVERVTRDISGE